MANDSSNDRTISLRERARQARRDAYQKAKAARAKDPRHLAMKEAVKQKRRELYQQIKTKRKADAKTQKAEDEKRRAAERAESRKASYDELKKLVKLGAGSGESEPRPTAPPAPLRLVHSDGPRPHGAKAFPPLRLVPPDPANTDE